MSTNFKAVAAQASTEGVPRTPRGAKTRRDLLDAAISEFARRGYAGGSTLEIARAANSRQPLVNYHYGSKEKLWQASVDFAFVELGVTFASIEETARDAEPIGVLKLMLRVLNRFATRHPRHIDIMRQEMGSSSAQAEYLLREHLAPMYRSINSVVDAAVAAGQIKPMPSEFVSSLMFGAVTHYFGTAAAVEGVYSLDVDDPGHAQDHGDWIVEVLFRGIEISPGPLAAGADRKHSAEGPQQ